jgi:hypothetical protein
MHDIVFISYQEPNAGQNFDNLFGRFNSVGVFGNRVKRVHGVKGIHNAHIAAATLATTNYFYVVDGDAEVAQGFKFAHTAEEEDVVHVWRSCNPINDLSYGYGGVKLLPTSLTRNIDTTTNDMTTSISNKFKVIEEVSNITAFNTDPFSTWRSAFRECVKLSSKTIKGQKNDETEERLRVWTTVGKDKPFGEYCIKGACAGMEFGLSDGADLKLINDFDWLKEQFND